MVSGGAPRSRSRSRSRPTAHRWPTVTAHGKGLTRWKDVEMISTSSMYTAAPWTSIALSAHRSEPPSRRGRSAGQMKRASRSVPFNIGEGVGKRGRARAAAYEVHSSGMTSWWSVTRLSRVLGGHYTPSVFADRSEEHTVIPIGLGPRVSLVYFLLKSYVSMRAPAILGAGRRCLAPT